MEVHTADSGHITAHPVDHGMFFGFVGALQQLVVVVVVVVAGVALATVPIKGMANVFCAVVDKQVNIADREESMPL